MKSPNSIYIAVRPDSVNVHQQKTHDLGRGFFVGFAPFGRSPFGDCTCSAEVNSACAKVLLRKTLVTPDCRRSLAPVCGANRTRAFFTFPKRTVGQIDKYSGFWYNEHKKRRICRCTLPMQGLLRRHGQSSFFEVAPYLSRYQAQPKTPKSETP